MSDFSDPLSTAEAALAQSRGRLEYTVKLAGIGFWYCDLPFDVLEWDVRVKDHFWLPPDAIVTIDTFYAQIHPDDREPTRQAIAQSIDGKTSYDIIYRTVEPSSGTVKYIRALGGTAYALDGSPRQFDGITVDVTAQRRDQERLAAIADELREQDRRKDEFLATLAHELRNPLAPIRTGLQLMRVSTDADQLSRTREMMERQLGHLVRMVDDLLDISRVTLGKITLVREHVELRTVLESALETVRPALDLHRHTLVLELPSESMQLDVDPTRIAQVIANLVSNAAKYTPPNGRITVAAVPDRTTQQLALRVSDTGIGISPAMLPSVFELFVQLGQSIDRSQGGLGIGLTLVRSLVALHGGAVHAASGGAGQGSTFTVTLPHAVAAAPSDAPADRRINPRSVRRVLLVDDNEDAAALMGAVLSRAGHDVRVTYDGPSALTAIRDFTPDVAVLDIGLPVMDGYDLAVRLREQLGDACKFIALTGYGGAHDRARSQASGFVVHLVKPVSAQALLEHVRADERPPT